MEGASSDEENKNEKPEVLGDKWRVADTLLFCQRALTKADCFGVCWKSPAVNTLSSLFPNPLKNFLLHCALFAFERLVVPSTLSCLTVQCTCYDIFHKCGNLSESPAIGGVSNEVLTFLDREAASLDLGS